jgi:hypothetical protein
MPARQAASTTSSERNSPALICGLPRSSTFHTYFLLQHLFALMSNSICSLCVLSIAGDFGCALPLAPLFRVRAVRRQFCNGRAASRRFGRRMMAAVGSRLTLRDVFLTRSVRVRVRVRVRLVALFGHLLVRHVLHFAAQKEGQRSAHRSDRAHFTCRSSSA